MGVKEPGHSTLLAAGAADTEHALENDKLSGM